MKIKRPFGRHVEDFPRRASFIATTNQADVLADPSGSRRFLSVELTGPIDVSTPPNYEQLYAQALVEEVDIGRNVFIEGAAVSEGNQAEVTGNTNVIIGKQTTP